MEPDSTTEPYSDPAHQHPYWASIHEGFVTSTTAPHSMNYDDIIYDDRIQVLHVTGTDQADLSDGDYPDPYDWRNDYEWDTQSGNTDDDDSDDDDDGDADNESDDSPPPSPILIDEVLNSDDDM
ncbi:uncharacterized protein isoform X2 [Leptinotarsa decemlineata]|uniref:uncharacterized protein isoform X2 n=1 Tax=Leptinotarsa decemlineata TaxID=7539 RepID=UPI003D30531D